MTIDSFGTNSSVHHLVEENKTNSKYLNRIWGRWGCYARRPSPAGPTGELLGTLRTAASPGGPTGDPVNWRALGQLASPPPGTLDPWAPHAQRPSPAGPTGETPANWRVLGATGVCGRPPPAPKVRTRQLASLPCTNAPGRPGRPPLPSRHPALPDP